MKPGLGPPTVEPPCSSTPPHDGAEKPWAASGSHSKLEVGESDDPLEREADRIADQVMRSPDPGSHFTPTQPRISAKCGSCEEEEQEEADQKLLTTPSTQGTAPSEAPVIVDEVLRSSGRPLESGVREFMEARLGRELGDVRIHTDGLASQSTEAVSARAYTVGRNVAFRRGEYAPHTTGGRRLLAHELAHVLQQQGQAGAGNAGASQPLSRSLLQRQDESPPPQKTAAELDQEYHDAVQRGDWPAAAEALNGFNHEDIQARLAGLSTEQTADLHRGAIDNPRVGPQSQVAQLTEPGLPQASTPPPQSTQAPPPSAAPAPAPAPAPGTPSPAPAPDPTLQMSIPAKLLEGIRRALLSKRVPAASLEQIKGLLEPEALATGILMWMASQYTGAGEVVDAIGVILEGMQIKDILEELWDYATTAVGASTNQELDEAADHLAKALAAALTAALLQKVLEKLGAKRKGESEGGKASPGEGEKGGQVAGERQQSSEQGADQSGKSTEEQKPADEKQPSGAKEAPEATTNEDVHTEDTEPEQAPATDPEMTPAICFPAGTLVHTATGLRPIEDLSVGDRVWAWRSETRTAEPQEITAVVRGFTTTWVDIELAGMPAVRSTPAHHYWVESESAWIAASDLEVGMSLQLRDGRLLEVLCTSTEHADDPSPTFNLSVDELSNFFVGRDGVLVHNMKQSRYARLNRPGYTNYVLRDAQGKIYYSGMYGDTTADAVKARHAANDSRFNPASDKFEIQPGTRTYGEARLMENQLAVDNGTIKGRVGDDYRCNRQRPLAEQSQPEYREYETIKAGCG